MVARSPLLLLLLLCAVEGLQVLPRAHWAAPLNMRSRLLRHAVKMSSDEDGSSEQPSGGEKGDAASFFKGLFTTNRDTPEAMANQRAWARQQMDLEVPDATLSGDSIADRAEFVRKYIENEKEKFGRDVDQATAEKEVDEWLLKQATYAPAQTSTADLALAAAVFVGAFGAGLFFANK